MRWMILGFILLVAGSCGEDLVGPWRLRSPCPPPLVGDSSPSVDLIPAWSPTGDFIVYFGWPTTGGQRLGLHRVFVDQDGRRIGDTELLLDLTGTWAGLLPPAAELRICPDGSKLAYWFVGDIWVLDLATLETKQVTFVGAARWPDWHPDGEWIVYLQNIGGSQVRPDTSGGMHIVNVRTLEDRQLTRLGGRQICGSHPRWDRGGRSIIFSLGDPETGNMSSEIFRVFPDSTDYIRLTRTGWSNEQPHWWYLNGEEVVFTSIDPDHRGMEYVLNVDTGSIRCFSSGGLPVNVRGFDFSPDHRKLVTTRVDTTGTIGVLWVLDIPTGRWHQLTAPPL